MSQDKELTEELLGILYSIYDAGAEPDGFDEEFLSKRIIKLVRDSEWMSVDDELPDKGGQCLVSHRSNGLAVGYWHENESRWGVFFAGDITHWMPLPSPPTKKGE